jgi:hypothetical protein
MPKGFVKKSPVRFTFADDDNTFIQPVVKHVKKTTKKPVTWTFDQDDEPVVKKTNKKALKSIEPELKTIDYEK